MQQLGSELAGATKNKTVFYGFIGASCNWFLGLAAVYDASSKGAEVISLPMTCVMIAYSTLFTSWAGWAVAPRNFILAGSHMFNVAAQCNQLRRVLEHKMTEGGAAARAEVQQLAAKAAVGGAAAAAYIAGRHQMKAAFKNGPAWFTSPAGPFTIHPWPPATKLLISGASLLEFDRPTDKISAPQYSALTVTGAIFSRYALLVSPINYPLAGVNVLLFTSSAYHLCRKIKADYIM